MPITPLLSCIWVNVMGSKAEDIAVQIKQTHVNYGGKTDKSCHILKGLVGIFWYFLHIATQKLKIGIQIAANQT